MFSTRQVAKKLGITHATLSRYITAGKVPEPEAVSSGGMTIHLWTETDIERLRELLPKIANGRKTRYQKQKGKTQKPQPRTPQPQHAKTARAGGPVAVPHKQRKKKK